MSNENKRIIGKVQNVEKKENNVNIKIKDLNYTFESNSVPEDLKEGETISIREKKRKSENSSDSFEVKRRVSD